MDEPWWTLENIMPSEISQRQRDKILYDSVCMTDLEQAKSQEGQKTGCQGLREKEMGSYCFMGSFCLGWCECFRSSDRGCKTLSIISATYCTLKKWLKYHFFKKEGEKCIVTSENSGSFLWSLVFSYNPVIILLIIYPNELNILCEHRNLQVDINSSFICNFQKF